MVTSTQRPNCQTRQVKEPRYVWSSQLGCPGGKTCRAWGEAKGDGERSHHAARSQHPEQSATVRNGTLPSRKGFHLPRRLAGTFVFLFQMPA